LTLGTDLYEFLGCWCECIWLLGSAGYCLESVKSDFRDVSACYQVAGPSGAGYTCRPSSYSGLASASLPMAFSS